jgi:hypothetical protein
MERAARDAADPSEKRKLLALDEKGRCQLVRERVEKVVISNGSVQVALKDGSSTASSRRQPRLRAIRLPFDVVRRGGAARILVNGRPEPPAGPNPSLVKAIARGYRWRERLLSGEVRSLGEIARREGVTPAYVGRVLPLGFLAPDIVQAILGGRLLSSRIVLDQARDLPVDWGAQRRALGL